MPTDWAAVLMGGAVLCVLLCGAAPLIAALITADAAAARGYRLCPPPSGERRPPMRWARAVPPARCPLTREQAEAMLG